MTREQRKAAQSKLIDDETVHCNWMPSRLNLFGVDTPMRSRLEDEAVRFIQKRFRLHRFSRPRRRCDDWSRPGDWGTTTSSGGRRGKTPCTNGLRRRVLGDCVCATVMATCLLFARPLNLALLHRMMDFTRAVRRQD